MISYSRGTRPKTIRRYLLWAGAIGAIGLIGPTAITGPAAVAQAPADRCTVALMRASAPPDTTVTSARIIGEPIALCKVEGYSTTTNPGPNKVAFGLQLPLPEKWNNRFYFIGVGGSGGGAVPSDAT